MPIKKKSRRGKWIVHLNSCKTAAKHESPRVDKCLSRYDTPNFLPDTRTPSTFTRTRAVLYATSRIFLAAQTKLSSLQSFRFARKLIYVNFRSLFVENTGKGGGGKKIHSRRVYRPENVSFRT